MARKRSLATEYGPLSIFLVPRISRFILSVEFGFVRGFVSRRGGHDILLRYVFICDSGLKVYMRKLTVTSYDLGSETVLLAQHGNRHLRLFASHRDKGWILGHRVYALHHVSVVSRGPFHGEEI